MKRAIYLAILLPACAGMIILSTIARTMRRRTVELRRNRGELLQQVNFLRQHVNVLTAAERASREELRRQSNLIAQAGAALAEEQATNNPLRGELARLAADEIKARRETEKARAALAAIDARNADRQNELVRQIAAGQAELESQRSRAIAAEADLERRTEELRAAQEHAASVAKQVDSWRAENARLKQQIEALRRDLAQAQQEAAARRNLPAPGPGPAAKE